MTNSIAGLAGKNDFQPNIAARLFAEIQRALSKLALEPETRPTDVITVVVDEQHTLGKSYRTLPNGSVDKKAQVSTSWAVAMQFNPQTPEDLAHLLRVVGASPHAAIVNAAFPAVPLGREFRIASQRRINELFGPEADPRGVHTFVENGRQFTVVARVKEQASPSSWQLLDRDVDEHTPPAMAEADFDAWLALADRILPGVAGATLVLVPSFSARVIQDGQAVGGGNGHVWLQVKDPADVERTRTAIIARAIASQLAWTKPKYSRTTGEIVGHAWTTVIDPSVWTVGRLVFCGAPTADKSLTVVSPEVRIIAGVRDRIDTSSATIDAVATQRASEAAGISLRITDEGEKLEMIAEDLDLATELELANGKTVSVQELMRNPTDLGKIRCQAPFRESSSFAAFFSIGPVIGPFVFDSGTGVKHVLPPVVREQALAALNGARFDALRRAAQKRDNELIGEGAAPIPTAQVITLEEAIARFVFMEDGSRVADRLKPHYDLSLTDFRNAYSASKKLVPQPLRQNADGSTTQRAPKWVLIADLWRASKRRLTVVGRTFKAGEGEFLQDPLGRSALNTWRPFDRSIVINDLQSAGIHLFVDQVQYLFGDKTTRFIEWLAHIEQAPGVLPHTCWLHIATQFGLGRNWLGGLLARVWAGSVAANFDLSATLKSGFNDRLSRKVLAIVDEVDEGGGESKWQHAETVKRMLTEETREINPKFGRKSVEYNACRMLLFSNHTHALPTVEGDRRVEVKIMRGPPRSADVYSTLYNALEDPQFIAAVAKYLGEYDLSNFNPGRRALMDESKAEFLAANQSQPAYWIKMLREHWPVDVIASKDLFRILDGDRLSFGGSADDVRNLAPAHRRTLAEYDIRSRGAPIKVDGTAMRIQVIRNHEKWQAATPTECRVELARWIPSKTDLRQELLELSAEDG